VVNFRPLSSELWEWTSVPIEEEAGWGPEPVWTVSQQRTVSCSCRPTWRRRQIHPSKLCRYFSSRRWPVQNFARHYDLAALGAGASEVSLIVPSLVYKFRLVDTYRPGLQLCFVAVAKNLVCVFYIWIMSLDVDCGQTVSPRTALNMIRQGRSVVQHKSSPCMCGVRRSVDG
jgi:hypothetical protein